MSTSPLRVWMRFQLAIDVGVGLLLLTLPLRVVEQLPIDALPEGTTVLTLRMVGLYPAALAIAFFAATANGVHARAAWVANAIRFTGGFALLSGATLDPAAPPLLRTMFAGEWLFAAITAFLMHREGHRWWRPA